MKAALRTVLLGIALGASTAAFAEEWGAIAVDLGRSERSPSYGVGGGSDQQEAMDRGVKLCREAGGANCAVVVTYRQCAAYSASRSDAAWGKASTKQAAEGSSLSDCKGGCKLVASGCT